MPGDFGLGTRERVEFCGGRNVTSVLGDSLGAPQICVVVTIESGEIPGVALRM